jgi:hypothetical protein
MKTVAVITTSYWPPNHADVLVGKLLNGFPTDDGLRPARVRVAGR